MVVETIIALWQPYPVLLFSSYLWPLAAPPVSSYPFYHSISPFPSFSFFINQFPPFTLFSLSSPLPSPSTPIQTQGCNNVRTRVAVSASPANSTPFCSFLPLNPIYETGEPNFITRVSQEFAVERTNGTARSAECTDNGCCTWKPRRKKNNRARHKKDTVGEELFYYDT